MMISKIDALVIIDPERDFVYPDGALFVKGFNLDPSVEDCISNIVQLGDQPFGHVALTRDIHPPIHIEHTILPTHCVLGTAGTYVINPIADTFMTFAGINAEILTKGSEANVIAFSVAFSPLFDAHLFRMRLKGIKRVFLCGWAYDYCVGESAIAYKVQGFDPFVIVDATRSVGEFTSRQMDRKLDAYDVPIVLMQDFPKLVV